MRSEGKSEFDSLYFDYPQFSPPDNVQSGTRMQVAIVGAGPVGLVAALTLARHGVASVVFDKKATFNDGSRAICIARQSYHILERLNALDPFLKKSLGWTKGQSFFRGQKVLEFEMPHGSDEKFLPMYNLQQQYIEQFLWQAVVASPLIGLRWQSEITGIQQRPDGGVCLQITDPLRQYEVAADWVLAADGAHSPVRKMRGIRLEGENLEGRYVIADLQMDHDFPTIRRAFFASPAVDGGTVLIHRQPDNIWRIDYQLGPDEPVDEALKEHNIRARIGAILTEIGHTTGYELEWWTSYTANTLALPDYRDGRVFFIGDSAHIVPIFGVRGLNNGIADGENIGWKLAMVVNGLAQDRLLDSYSVERRGATLDVFTNASKSARFMTPPTKGWALMRDAALSLALDTTFTRPFINPRQMQPFSYANSPITTADDPAFLAGPRPGDVVTNVAFGDGRFLTDWLGHGFALLVFCDTEQADTLDFKDSDGLLFTALHIGSDGADQLPDTDGKIANKFGAVPGSAYLIRPDGHIAARWYRASQADVTAAMQQILQGKGVLE